MRRDDDLRGVLPPWRWWRAVWREIRHRPPEWWEHTDGDYIDLRPRLQIGRRKWL